MNETSSKSLIERLRELEYAIRQSITVREDQEEAAEPSHRDEAGRNGIHVDEAATKGDLLNAVQTAMRAAIAHAENGKSPS